eukprot:3066264-Lingulodinium_polyedra.AAC.1
MSMWGKRAKPSVQAQRCSGVSGAAPSDGKAAASAWMRLRASCLGAGRWPSGSACNLRRAKETLATAVAHHLAPWPLKAAPGMCGGTACSTTWR